MVVTVIAVGALAVVAGSSSLSLPVVAVLTTTLIVFRVHQDLLLPHVTAALERIASVEKAVAEAIVLPRIIGPFAGILAVVGSGAIAYLLGARGLLGVVAVAAVLGLLLVVTVAWPLVLGLTGRDAGAPPIPSQQIGPRSEGTQHGAATSAFLMAGATAVAAGGAFFISGMGMKGVAATVGVLVVGGALLVSRDRVLVLTFGMTLSLVLMLHKSFSAINVELSGGAVAIYITTFDVMIVLCYLGWLLEGTLLSDLRVAFRSHVRWALALPLWCAIALLPSLLVAPDTLLSVSELVRMGWMYLAFVFVAVRVRTRRYVWAVVGGLGAFAVIELAVVVLQWRTGGVLGLSFLGVPTELGERVTNDGSLGRPFGTIIHPVFMGAVMGSLGCLALGLACTLRRSLTQRVALASVPVCLLPLYLSHTRASLVAFVATSGVVILWSVKRGWVTQRALRLGAVAIVTLGIVFAPNISEKVSENFGTAHYDEEVRSRLELNDAAGRMIADRPIVGVGLNNFEAVMDPYQQYGLIFADNPVHNLYLLFLSETGIIGFIGFVCLGIGLYAMSMRLARSRDSMFAGVGIGVTAMMGFLMVEEILGFSLRQDVPLAMYWLLAGLAVSCTVQSCSDGTLDRRAKSASVQRSVASGRHRVAPSRRRSLSPRPVSVARVRRPAWGYRRITARFRVLVVLLVLLPTESKATPEIARSDAFPAGSRADAAWDKTHLLLSATSRTTGHSGIYRVAPGGTPVLITPDDGRTYSWPTWSADASKVTYTVRNGGPGAREEIEVMNPDGTRVQQVTSLGFRTGQPKFSSNGRSIIFTRVSPDYEIVGIYQVDIVTQRVTNLSAVSRPVAATDADPRFTSDGRIIFSEIVGKAERVSFINGDGTKRTVAVDDGFFNTDPDLSPDGRLIATASFRGGGDPRTSGGLGDSAVRIDQWYLAVHPATKSGNPRPKVLNRGMDCTVRAPDNPCGPADGSAFKPVWSPDGATIGYETTLDRETNCICVISPDASNPSIRFATRDLAVTWFDWTGRSPVYGRAVLPLGVSRGQDRMLITAEDRFGNRSLLDSEPDRSVARTVLLNSTVVPDQANWSADRRLIVFSARTSVPPSGTPHPAPPKGQQRREQFTLDDLAPTGVVPEANDEVVEQQVFLRTADGTVRQLTDAYTEDWRDGHPRGDLNGNSAPVLSATGKMAVYTSTSMTTGHSSVMSINLVTGEVLSLSNATAGATATDDDRPTISPDGRHVVFSTTIGTSRELAVVDLDGYGFTQLTDDEWYDTNPKWSPDGNTLIFASFRGTTQATVAARGNKVLDGTGWAIVRLDLKFSGPGRLKQAQPSVLSKHLPGPTIDPTWSPSGDRIAWAGRGPSSIDLFWIPAIGGQMRTVGTTPFVNEIHVDWR